MSVGRLMVSRDFSSNARVRHWHQLISTIFVAVYKIPPLKANEGHRANDWGDLAKPLWKGRLRIMERNDGATIQFEDTNTGASYSPS